MTFSYRKKSHAVPRSIEAFAANKANFAFQPNVINSSHWYMKHNRDKTIDYLHEYAQTFGKKKSTQGTTSSKSSDKRFHKWVEGSNHKMRKRAVEKGVSFNNPVKQEIS